MTEIRLDGSKWKPREDFYDALLPLLGAPAWHGRNLDALSDSLSSGEINEVNEPIRFLLVGTSTVPSELRNYLKQFAELVGDLPVDRGANVELICEPPL